MACQIAGEVKGFEISDYISPKEARRNDLFIHYGIAAALQAVADAGLDDIPAWTRPASASTSVPASAACR